MRPEHCGKTPRPSRFILTIRSATCLAEQGNLSTGYWQAAQRRGEVEIDEEHRGLFATWVNVLRPSEGVSFAKGPSLSGARHSSRSRRPGRSQETWLYDHGCNCL